MPRYDSLNSTLRRARNVLWRQRARPWLWGGIALSALLINCAGLAHILLVPVPTPLWLALLALGPIAAAITALLVLRPDLATAASAIDRWGGYQGLFSSAWEAHNTPPAARPLGAEVALRRAQLHAACAGVPPDQPEVSHWSEHLRYIPLALLGSGLFLLQLPGVEPATPLLIDQPPAPGLASEKSLLSASRSPEYASAMGAPAVSPVAPESRSRPESTSQSTQPNVLAVHEAEAQTGVGAMPFQQGGREKDMAQAGVAPLPQNPMRPGQPTPNNSPGPPGMAPMEPVDLSFQQPVTYFDIQRGESSDGTIQGPERAALDAGPGDPERLARYPLDSQPQVADQDAHASFAPSERWHIAEYFQRIEEFR